MNAAPRACEVILCTGQRALLFGTIAERFRTARAFKLAREQSSRQEGAGVHCDMAADAARRGTLQYLPRICRKHAPKHTHSGEQKTNEYL